MRSSGDRNVVPQGLRGYYQKPMSLFVKKVRRLAGAALIGLNFVAPS